MTKYGLRDFEMRPGKLDRLMALQTLGNSTDAYGGETQVWTTVATIWAGKRDTKGREYLASAAERSENTAIFTIRWRDGMTTKCHRLTDSSGVYNIVNIAEIGRKEGLELTTVRVV